ncbi:MAG: hypothetical protein IKD89_05415 [Clostridia bacterium]|nr:hypothetical protein [Clostridia bacterium]
MARRSEKKIIVEDEKQRKDNVIGSRLLALLALSVAYIFILMFLYNSITGLTNIVLGFTAIKVIFYVSIGLLAASLVFFIVRRVRKTDEEYKVVTGGNTLATFIVFFAASALIYKYDVAAIKLMYVVIPVWFLIYMIYKLYVREFFTVSLTAAIGSALLFFMYKLGFVSAGVEGSLLSAVKPFEIGFLIIFIALVVLECIVIAMSKKNQGRLTKSKTSKHIASMNAEYPPLFIAPAIFAACLIVSLFYSQILFYGMFVLAGFWFIMFIYYTYVMMKK